MRQAIIGTNADSIQWRIYAALGGDELKASMGEKYTMLYSKNDCLIV